MHHVRFLLLIVVILLTSGCGVVNTFIPDQVIINPLSIDNWPVLLKSETLDATLSTQTPGVTLRGSHTVELPDFDGILPPGVSPSVYEIELGFQDGITVASSTALPDTITLHDLTLDVTLYNGNAHSSDRVSYTIEQPVDLILHKNANCVTFCAYTWDASSREAAAQALSTSIRGSVLRDALRVLQNTPAENTAIVQLLLASDLPQEHQGAALTVRVRSERGVMKF